MTWIIRYRVILMGVAVLVLAVLLSSGKKEQPSSAFMVDSALRAPSAVPAAAGGEAAGQQVKETRQSTEETRPKSAKTKAVVAEDAPADSTDGKESEAGFDEVEARRKAVAKVEDFNKELASELRTVNPNARKTKLKAAELKQKATELEGWIKSQDGNTGMTSEERMEWESQREVWVNHVKEIRQVAQRLAATHGTKRKVRILAKEISD